MTDLRKSILGGIALGAAVGTGVVLYQDHQAREHSFDTLAQRRINRALDHTLKIARRNYRVKLNPDSRVVIFSDHHKGAGDKADDFLPCKPTYHAALDHYETAGFTLVLLGDVEEFWENEIPEVIRTHADVFESEARFYPHRYYRIIGNHDDAWNNPQKITPFLGDSFNDIHPLPGLVLDFEDENTYGEIFLAHGHQGTLDADQFSWLPPRVLPLYRQIQNKLNIGHTTPAEDEYLRGRHDTQMYRWALRQRNLIFIAGHTHRPVWTSLTHLDQLVMKFYALRLRKEKLDPADYQSESRQLVRDIKKRMSKEPSINDTVKTIPAYFNTGCCRFSDGDITGIEVVGQDIHLVKWDKDSLERESLVSMPLADLFALL